MLTQDEWQHVRWWDYLWFLVPVAGPACFALMVVSRERAADARRGEG